MEKNPFKKNDRINHTILGKGTIRDTGRTPGNRQTAYVEFDETHPRLQRGETRYGTILIEFLEKSDEKPVEFGMNILDI